MLRILDGSSSLPPTVASHGPRTEATPCSPSLAATAAGDLSNLPPSLSPGTSSSALVTPEATVGAAHDTPAGALSQSVSSPGNPVSTTAPGSMATEQSQLHPADLLMLHSSLANELRAVYHGLTGAHNSLSVYLYFSPSVYLPACLHVLSTCLSVCFSVCLPFCPPFCLCFVCPSIPLSFNMFQPMGHCC